MPRVDHYQDPDAPRPNSLVPAASVVVVQDGKVLMHRRRDTDRWSIPGGGMEPGESIKDTAIREAREETGYDVEVDRLVGVFSDPGHVVAFDDGEVRQQFSVCFAGHVVGGSPRLSDETREVGWHEPGALRSMTDAQLHPSILLRIEVALRKDEAAYIG
ncbi:NUDIX domain-containing protein [Kineococcus sp. SYSU DK003]|uniref:NUDIX domain-containing protein n=1 Tax=Kineococcus sp. SYSU DK003 TaxID=3383124 RepID=UPI003D7CFC85